MDASWSWRRSISVLSAVQYCALVLWILYIPSQLAYHFPTASSYVSGILIDYRIASLPASTVLLVIFLITTIMTTINNRRHSNTNSTTFFPTLARWTSTAIIISIITQTIVSMYQFTLQKSVFGYLPFGEVSYAVPTLAKGTLPNGALYTLPYGFSAHPNVLAGSIVVMVLLVLFLLERAPSNRAVTMVLIGCALTIALLTQSLSALLALWIGLFIYIYQGKKTHVSLLRMTALVFPIIVVIILSFPANKESSNPTLSRRAHLQQAALFMMRDYPITGVGLNNFTASIENYVNIGGSVRFLQPVHHVFLLLITELGLLGWVIILFITRLLMRIQKDYLHVLIPLIILASLDHYLWSLGSGRMLLILSLLVWLIASRNQDSHDKIVNSTIKPS